MRLSLYPLHRTTSAQKSQILTERTRSPRPSRSLHTAAPFTSEPAVLLVRLLSASATWSFHCGSPEDFEVPDPDTYCTCSPSEVLRATGREVGKPPTEPGHETGLTSLSLLEGFSARCCDCWEKKGEKQRSLPQLKVRNEAKKERKMNKLGKRSKRNPLMRN